MSCSGCPFRGTPEICRSCGVLKKDRIFDKDKLKRPPERRDPLKGGRKAV